MFVWGALSGINLLLRALGYLPLRRPFSADHHGRIPVILLGTTGTAFFTLLFGLSGSLTSVLINRFLGWSTLRLTETGHY